MNQKLALVALVVLIVGGALWFFLQDERGGGRTAVAPAPAESPAAKDTEAPAAPDLTAASAPAESERSEVGAPVEPARAALAVEHQTFPLDKARWVDVTVVLPRGMPAEDARLLAFADPKVEVDEDDRLDVSKALDLGDGFVEDIDDDLLWSRRPLAGTVRVPFPAEAEHGFFLLQSRWLYLDPISVDLGSASAITLEPELGAHVVGRIGLPPGASAPDAEEIEVGFAGRPKDSGLMNGFRHQDEREVRVADDLTFELRALSPQRKYMVHTEAEGLVGKTELSLEFSAGEEREVALAFTLGGTVLGLVRGEDGTPIAEADVTARSRSFDFMGGGASVKSGADGRFALRGVAAGKATLQAQKEGWLEGKGEPLVLAEGETISGVEIVLASGGRVAGLVRWPDGVPAAKVEVSAYRERNGGWMQQVTETKSDEGGAFTLSGLEEGPFEILAQAQPDDETLKRFGIEPPPKVAGVAASPSKLELPEGVSQELQAKLSGFGKTTRWLGTASAVAIGTTGLELTLARPLEVAGRVVDDRRQPLASFRIEAKPGGQSFNGPQDVSQFVSEAKDGAFVIAVPREGEWSFTAHGTDEGGKGESEPVSVAVPLGAPLELVLPRTATLSGTVADPGGHPVAGAQVHVPRSGRSGRFGFDEGDGATSDDSGHFTLENVQGTSVALVAEHEDWAPSLPLAVELEPGASKTGLELTLRVGARITGEVFDAEGKPKVGQNVTAGTGTESMAFGFGADNAARSDGAGHFEFEHVEPGKVTVTAMPSEEELAAKLGEAEDESAFLEIMGQMSTATVEVGDGQEAHVVLGSKPRKPVRVHGQVSEAGTPLVNRGLLVFAEGGALLSGAKAARTGEDGRYEIVLDRPGDYVFGVNPGQDFDGAGVQFFVEVPEGEELERDFALPLGVVSGRVLTPEGKGASGIPLRLASSQGMVGIEDLSDSNRSTSKGDGTFRFEHLMPGDYALHVGAGLWELNDARYGAVVVEDLRLKGDDAIEGLEVHLSEPGKISGIVRDESGAPVADVGVFVRDESGRALTISGTSSDASGRFTYQGIAPGRVTVSARSATHACPDGEPVQVKAGETAEVELTITRGTFVKVSLIDGENAVRARLKILDEQGRRVDDLFSLHDFQALFTEGFSSKERRVGPVPPGKYTLIATTMDGKDAKKSIDIEPGQKERSVKLRLR